MSKTVPNIITRIEADHDRLKMVKRSLVRFVEDAERGHDFLDWKIEALFQVRDFQNRLAKHFDLEEQGGFFAELLRLAPQASYQLKEIAAEHAEILSALDETIEWLKGAESNDPDVPVRLRADVHHILDQLRAHQTLEHEMMFSAHNQVFGVVD